MVTYPKRKSKPGKTRPPTSAPAVADTSKKIKKFKNNCYNCNKWGHCASECKQPKRGESSTPTTDNKANVLFQTAPTNFVVMVGKEKASTEWWLDSGATCHVCNNSMLLEDVTAADETVTVANGEIADVLKVGTATLLLSSGVIFVYDLSQRRTKASLQNWAAEIASTGTFSVPLESGGLGGLPVPYLIIANKTDISSNQRHESSGNLVDVARMWVEKQGLLPPSEELPLTDSFPGNSSIFAAAKEARYDKESVMKFFKKLIRRRYFPDEQPAPSPWPVPPVSNSKHLDNQIYSSLRVDQPTLHSQRNYSPQTTMKQLPTHNFYIQRISETKSSESDNSKLEIAEIN